MLLADHESSGNGQPLRAPPMPGDDVSAVFRPLLAAAAFSQLLASGPLSTDGYRISAKDRTERRRREFTFEDHLRVGHAPAAQLPARKASNYSSGDRPAASCPQRRNRGRHPFWRCCTRWRPAPARQVLWLYAARDGTPSIPPKKSAALIRRCSPRGARYVCYSRPGPGTKYG